MVKKQSEIQKNTHVKGSAYLAIVVGVVVLAAIVGLATYMATHNANQKMQNIAASQKVSSERKDRIEKIYDSLKIGSDFALKAQDVFGEKRVYDWDSQRTYSSSKTYLKSTDVNVTVAEIKPLIEAAGFTYFEEPYPGSKYVQLHFKSAKNEYLRLNVSSQAYDDALGGAGISAEDSDKLDANAGPSMVVIKVNLDDNNE